jgi:hypothetical protein
MAGQISTMINEIINQRSKGNASIAETTKTKLILKGIDPSKFNASSPDDPAVMEKLKQIAKTFNVSI